MEHSNETYYGLPKPESLYKRLMRASLVHQMIPMQRCKSCGESALREGVGELLMLTKRTLI
jgi:hypothetical protein